MSVRRLASFIGLLGQAGHLGGAASGELGGSQGGGVWGGDKSVYHTNALKKAEIILVRNHIKIRPSIVGMCFAKDKKNVSRSPYLTNREPSHSSSSMS